VFVFVEVIDCSVLTVPRVISYSSCIVCIVFSREQFCVDLSLCESIAKLL
jgi:hypothetical protein